MIAKMLLTAAVLAAGAAAQDPNAELERLRRSLGNSRAEVAAATDILRRRLISAWMSLNASPAEQSSVNGPSTPGGRAVSLCQTRATSAPARSSATAMSRSQLEPGKVMTAAFMG